VSDERPAGSARPSSPSALRDLDPTGRFSSRAVDYARYRPTYPTQFFDEVLAGLGAPDTLVAADVGAGTGISSRALGDRGVQVLAIEPNLAMRDVATPHPRVRWIDATAERTRLPGASVDVVLCAQSFHWFETGPALLEFLRILRPRGRVALVWNGRVKGDPAGDAYDRLVKDAATVTPQHLELPPMATLLSGAGFVDVREAVFPGGQRLDYDGLVGRARSASYVPKEGPAWERLVDGLRALHARHADAQGAVFVAQNARAWLAQAPA